MALEHPSLTRGALMQYRRGGASEADIRRMNTYSATLRNGGRLPPAARTEAPPAKGDDAKKLKRQLEEACKEIRRLRKLLEESKRADEEDEDDDHDDGLPRPSSVVERALRGRLKPSPNDMFETAVLLTGRELTLGGEYVAPRRRGRR